MEEEQRAKEKLREKLGERKRDAKVRENATIHSPPKPEPMTGLEQG